MGTRAWALLFVLCGTIFLEGIDVAMMAVAIPSIRADLGLTTGTAAWVMSAYVLGYAGFTLLGGRAADLLGRRRMFLLWLTVFLGFSGLGGFATEGWMLVLARFVTGVSAAFMTPAALSLITTEYEEGPRRDKALLIFAGTAAGGFSFGLVAGGLLTRLGWRWVFFAPVLLTAALLLAAVRPVPRQDGPCERGRGAATDGVAEEEQGLASGLLHTATQFGSAIGISAVTAVYGLASTGSGPEDTLSAFRTALVVPVVMVALGLLVSALSARAERRAERQASAVSSVRASQTSANPAQRSAGIASRK
ncbi:MFS transporter [Streptomyces sp. P17]|nr:MFS transporter [Streptomyces sp. P17]MDT9699165.1 MFS transporter [Streptomyces sp. P17]